jgi:hypothetical protein
LIVSKAAPSNQIVFPSVYAYFPHHCSYVAL